MTQTGGRLYLIEPFLAAAVDRLMTTKRSSQRDALLDAVSSVLSEAGPSNDDGAASRLSIERICAIADVSPDEMRTQFGSRRGLVEAWFAERVYEAGIMASELPGAADAGFAERLEAFCFVLLDVLDEYPGADPHTFHKYATGFVGKFPRCGA